MFDLIDIYVKVGSRWEYVEGTRMHRTLTAAAQHASNFHGVECRTKWAV